jgi:hypothetical protein
MQGPLKLAIHSEQLLPKDDVQEDFPIRGTAHTIGATVTFGVPVGRIAFQNCTACSKMPITPPQGS